MTECAEVAWSVLRHPGSTPCEISLARLVLVLVDIIREHADEHEQ